MRRSDVREQGIKCIRFADYATTILRSDHARRNMGLMLFLGLLLQAIAPSVNLRPASAKSPPQANLIAAGWMTPWTKRMEITVASDSIASNDSLESFPVLLVLNEEDQLIFDSSRLDGGDLVITKADGVTPLPREVVSYDPVANQAEIWFQADALSRSNNTFYLYYGNPTASTPPADGSVWDPKYVAVYHFSDDPGAQVLRDFGSRANDAHAGYQSIWTSSDTINGQIGRAWNFDGVTHFIDADAISTQDSSFVISAWAMLTSRTTDFAFQANPGFWHVSFQINTTHYRPHYAIDKPLRDLRWTPNPLPLDGQFHLFTWVFNGDADTIFFYYDGIQQPATPHWIDPSVQHFYTGHPINPTGVGGVGVAGPMSLNSFDIMNGAVDEFRVRERVLSSEWIRTEYSNQRYPRGFIQMGPEESAPPLAVTLESFIASPVQEGVALQWSVSDQSADHLGFHVYRQDGTDPIHQLTTELLSGRQSYTWIDRHPSLENAEYWLAEWSLSGEPTWFGPVQSPTTLSTHSLVFQNQPNPFSKQTVIRLVVSEQGRHRVRVFDVKGREIAVLFDAAPAPGLYSILWNGRSAKGIHVPPGIYYYRLDSPHNSQTRRLVLLQ